MPPRPISVLSIDREEELVSLSLLPEDTGKSDVLPESLGLPLRLVGKEKNKRKLSESEQASHRLTDSHAYLFCFQTRETDFAFPDVFLNVFSMFCLILLRSRRRKRKNQRLMATTVESRCTSEKRTMMFKIKSLRLSL